MFTLAQVLDTREHLKHAAKRCSELEALLSQTRGLQLMNQADGEGPTEQKGSTMFDNATLASVRRDMTAQRDLQAQEQAVVDRLQAQKQEIEQALEDMQPISSNSKKCKNCGSSVSHSAKFCSECGAKL